MPTGFPSPDNHASSSSSVHEFGVGLCSPGQRGGMTFITCVSKNAFLNYCPSMSKILHSSSTEHFQCEDQKSL